MDWFRVFFKTKLRFFTINVKYQSCICPRWYLFLDLISLSLTHTHTNTRTHTYTHTHTHSLSLSPRTGRQSVESERENIFKILHPLPPTFGSGHLLTYTPSSSFSIFCIWMTAASLCPWAPSITCLPCNAAVGLVCVKSKKVLCAFNRNFKCVRQGFSTFSESRQSYLSIDQFGAPLARIY